MKYLSPPGAVLISHPGRRVVLSSKVAERAWCGVREWFGGGIVSEAGDECARECEIISPDSFLSAAPFSGGGLKNDGGSFLSRIGSDWFDVGVLGAVFGFITWLKSASRSLSESVRTWTMQLLFFISITAVLACSCQLSHKNQQPPRTTITQNWLNKSSVKSIYTYIVQSLRGLTVRVGRDVRISIAGHVAVATRLSGQWELLSWKLLLFRSISDHYVIFTRDFVRDSFPLESLWACFRGALHFSERLFLLWGNVNSGGSVAPIRFHPKGLTSSRKYHTHTGISKHNYLTK